MVVLGGLHTAVKLSAHMTTKIERPRIDVQRQLVTITPVNRGTTPARVQALRGRVAEVDGTGTCDVLRHLA